jgi:O-antigen/teichoic acid export membrane protein
MSAPDQAEDRSAQLRDAAFSGVRWVLVARIGGEVSAFASAVTLARLIPPAEFGRASVALALVPLAVILTFEGCASALVQRPEITRDHEHGAVIMSVGLGLILSLVTFLLAGPVADPLFNSRTAHLVQLVSPVFLLASIGAVPRALLWRRLELRRVSVIEVVALFSGAGVSVAMALNGYDAEAIIGGALAATAVSSVMLYASAPYGLRLGNRESRRDMARFGIPAAGAGLVFVAFSNADYVILAARLSATHAGLYWRAFQLGVSYQEKISGVMLRLAFPVYARTQGTEELRHIHERATRLHATLLVPLLGMLIATAPVLVPWMFGPAWTGAVLPCQLLAVAGMIAAVLTGYPQVMLAVGKPRTLLRFNVCLLAGYVVLILIAVQYGLTAVCISVVGAYILLMLSVYRFLLGPAIGVTLRDLWNHIAAATTACVVLLAISFPLREALVSAGMPALVTLFVTGAAGGIGYLLTVRAAFPAAWDDILLVVRRVAPARPRRRAAEPALEGG